jgi:hypothetical protein
MDWTYDKLLSCVMGSQGKPGLSTIEIVALADTLLKERVILEKDLG